MSAAIRSRIPPPLWVLLRVNGLQMWRRLGAIRQQSRLLTFVIGSFMAGYLVVSFWLFWKGLSRVAHFPGLGMLLMERLIFLLFAILFVLLLLSNLVISYTNLFRNRETAALLALPVTTKTLFQWKLIESTLLASWAFLFLTVPFLVAYGLARQAAWHFYLITPGLIALFIVLPGAAGAWAAVTLARFIERRTFQVVTVGLAGALLTAVAFWLRPEPGAESLAETRVLEVLDKILVKTKLAQYPLLPSYWLSSGVLHWTDGAVAAAVFYMLVLLSNVLFFGALSFTRMGRYFYEAASAVQSRGRLLGRWGWFRLWLARQDRAGAVPGGLERWAGRLRWLAPDVRALVIKDVRLFWRDTTQWAQSVMLFGLLAVYILNLRHFSLQLSSPFWVHLVAHLNLGACALNLATITTRFVYPQFSLEGRRLWIVGLAPLGLPRLVKTKFALALGAAWGITVGLMLLSSHMLRMPATRMLYFAVAVAVMSGALTGLAVGLGVLYPNFKEDNPSKIVSGFGGTFCLVLSFLYILASVCLLGFGSPWAPVVETSFWRVAGCLGGFVALSLALGWVPMRLAMRRLRDFEM